ncbi:MAG: preprotein translocase subunit SecG [Clostridia bacterium]|nr:preprotein translocase subunit SecG [Clostridia bacterium]
MDLILGIVLLVAAIFLVVAVLMQNGKSRRLSGTIAGGAETFFGKEKGKAIDKKLSKITAIVAVVFVVFTLVAFLIQDQTDYDRLFNELSNIYSTTPAETTPVGTTPADTTPVDTTPADTTPAIE